MQVDWLQLLGRLHPMVLHLPIGLILGLAALEGLGAARRRTLAREARVPLAWLAALSAVAAAASGYALSLEGERGGATLTNHMLLGFAFAGLALISAALGHFERLRKVYGVALALTVFAMMPAGHLGASMTHGPDFLLEPFGPREARTSGGRSVGIAAPRPEAGVPVAGGAPATNAAASEAAGPGYERVAEIFAQRCISCHGEDRQKGGLALHTPEAILKGGRDGVVIVAGRPQDSELVHRLRLPLNDEDHMPPESREQPSEDELRAIETWIAAGAAFSAAGMAPGGGPTLQAAAGANSPAVVSTRSFDPLSMVGEPLPPEEEEEIRARIPKETGTAGEPAGAIPPAVPEFAARVGNPDAAAIAALRARLVHVEAIDPAGRALAVDFTAGADRIEPAEIDALLAPLRYHVVSLSLARTRADASTLNNLPAMPGLERLDLRATAVTDGSLAALSRHPRLRELVLSQTGVSDTAVGALAELPALRRLFVWKTALSAQGLARLRAARAELRVDADDMPDAAAAEVEPELQFSSDAPLPGATSGAEGATAASLKPVNGCCPVTGKPLDARYSIVFEGRVIGFCCPTCVAQFWAEPDKFRANIR